MTNEAPSQIEIDLRRLRCANSEKSIWFRLVALVDEIFWAREVIHYEGMPPDPVDPVSHADAWKAWVNRRNHRKEQ
jgi:hypothetical protein